MHGLLALPQRSNTQPISEQITMPITSTTATEAQRAWLQQYEDKTGFEPMHQEQLDSGEMTFAAVARANIDWFEAWSTDSHLAIQKNNPAADDEDDRHASG